MTQQDEIAAVPTPMKRVAFASFVGTAIENYDFYIYGTAAALIFPVVFFPNMGPMMAAFVVVSIVSTALLPETKGTTLDAVGEVDSVR